MPTDTASPAAEGERLLLPTAGTGPRDGDLRAVRTAYPVD